MTRRLFVHVGPPKTGTTAIQSLFRDLGDPRLAYPTAGQWPDGAHNLLTFALRGETSWGAIVIPPVAELMPQVSAELDAAPADALISSEGLANVASYRQLLDALGPTVARFDAVIPILTLRHPLERAASDYNQRVKDAQHGERALPDDDLARRIDALRITPMIEAWRRVSPETRLLSYHPAESLLARFCALVGRPDLTPPETPWRNRSLGGVGLALLLLGNRLLPDPAARHRFLAEDLKDQHGLRLWRGASFPYSDAAVDRAMATTVTPDLEAARDRHGVDLTAWTRPPRATLSEADRAQIRQVAEAFLPASDRRAAEIEAVMAAFPAA
ncbi:hypothetical protein [Roseicyclus persicicus]|uniref:Uncharacterized protein n=1 Tax=Roseicyclus persicicus TaxID=2650661 RepID=A0A7X6JY37_9RHOB|nr:hypothetical protein [Roseibacterium persicicum]NKX46227.1 hypothetical protein [Roseibacterium persicicum]